jgi:uncharacterized SAM-binding protein YcdF (DUF218 family)
VSLLALSVARVLDPTFLLLSALGAALGLGTYGLLRAPLRRTRIAARTAWGVWGALWLLSLPRVSWTLTSWVEVPPNDVSSQVSDVDEERRAMVVLSGGLGRAAEGATPREALGLVSAARVIGAAALYRRVPTRWIVVSGQGEGRARDMTEAMADLLVAEGVPKDRIVLEPWSRDTQENALYSTMLLEKLGATRVILVTSAVHMKRSVKEFASQGVDVVPAPVDFTSEPTPGLASLLPSSGALFQSHVTLHELFGRLEPRHGADDRWGGGPPPDWDERHPPRPR